MYAKNTKRASVLVVEDDDGVRQSMRRILEDEDFQVFTATNGSEALAMMRKVEFAAVVSDHSMPGMDGVQVLKISRCFFPRTARVLATSADELEIAARAVNEANVDAIVQKPWQGEKLGDLVRSALERRRAANSNVKVEEAAGAAPDLAPAKVERAAEIAAVAVAQRPARRSPPSLPKTRRKEEAKMETKIEAEIEVEIAAKARPTVEPMRAEPSVVIAPDVARPIEPIAAPLPMSPPVIAPATTPLTVLAVDDDAGMRRFYDRALRAAGYEPHTAPSVATALKALQAGTFGLVLLDMNMPSHDGIELARRVRRGEAGERNREIPIVFVTGDDSGDSFESSFEVGALRYLCKPVEEAELLGVIDSVLHGA